MPALAAPRSSAQFTSYGLLNNAPTSSTGTAYTIRPALSRPSAHDADHAARGIEHGTAARTLARVRVDLQHVRQVLAQRAGHERRPRRDLRAAAFHGRVGA